MGDNNREETLRLQRIFADISEFEMQQAREDLEAFRGEANTMTFNVQVTIKSLRKAADKLDEVWKDCKIAHACGTTGGIVGGVLTIAGGVGTIMTAGIASPLLLVGMGVGVAGAGINLGTSILEASINSSEIQKAEKNLKETLDCINNVRNNVQLWLDRKEEARLLFIFCLAIQTLELSDPVVKLLQQVLLNVTNLSATIVEAAKSVFVEVQRRIAQEAGNAGAQAAGKAAGKATGKAAGKAAGKAGAKAAGKAGAKASGRASLQFTGKTTVQNSVQVAGQTTIQTSVQVTGQAGVQTAGQAGAQTAGRAGVQAAGDVAESGAKAGAKAGSKLAGGLIIGVSIPFLVWDAIDLGFTIRDIVENKGSEAAQFLREKADELERVC